MHILMIGFPLRIGVGFFFLGLIFTLIATYMAEFIADIGSLFHNIAASAR